MNITCPHCSQTLELTPDVLAALQGQPHFACPVCEGLMTVPALRPTHSAPRRSSATKPASQITKAQRGLNRNLLVLGVAALLTLGGVAVFLASKNGGTTVNTFQNITNEIIHNSYFTQLIADAVTTEKDLEAIAEIRPYEGGFIGVSKEALSWEQAQNLAKRTGAEILAVDDAALGSKQELVTWLATTFMSHLSSSIWVLNQSECSVLAGLEVLGVKELDGSRNVLLHWQPANTSLASATKDAPAVQSITQQILHNSYFTQLIADGVTTEKDLEAIAEIRSYGGGFIGISQESLLWQQAEDLAKQVGARVLPLGIPTEPETLNRELIDCLYREFVSQLSSQVWCTVNGHPRFLVVPELDVTLESDRLSKTLFLWKPHNESTDSVLSVVQSTPEPDADGWISLFDGTRLYACDRDFLLAKSGEVNVSDGELSLSGHSVFVAFEVSARNVSVRALVKKVGGKNVSINCRVSSLGRYTGYFNGRDAKMWNFGFGKHTPEWTPLKGGKSTNNIDEFVLLEMTAKDHEITLKADGELVVMMIDSSINQSGRIAIRAIGSAVFKNIQYKVLD